MFQNFLHIPYFIQSNPTTNSLDLGNIMEPEPISFSFETIGWQVLFALLFIGFVYAVYIIYQNYQHNKYRRDAIKSIQELNTNFSDNTVENINKVLFVLKQTALQTFDRKQVAALYGNNWLDFLDQKVKQTNFKQYERIIKNAAYKEELEDDFDATSFITMSIKWIKEHA